MIRRLLSLAAGFIATWALMVLSARLLLGQTPAQLMMGVSDGHSALLKALAVALACGAAVGLVLGKIPLVKRAWLIAGALAMAALFCAFALLLFGASLV